jgi:hypothetical protein
MIRRYIKDNHVCVELQIEDGNYFMSADVGDNRDIAYLDLERLKWFVSAITVQ